MHHRQMAVLLAATLLLLAYVISAMPTTDRTLTETDRTLTETDRTLTETDRTLTETDRTLTETDRTDGADITQTPQTQPRDDDDDEPHDTDGAGHVEHQDETYDDDDNDDDYNDDDVYDDEEFIDLLLKDHSPSEDDDTEPKPTSSNRADAVTSSSVARELSGLTDDPNTGYDESLPARKRNSGAVHGMPNTLSVSTDTPGQSQEINTATSSVGSTPNSDEGVGSQMGGLSGRMTSSGESVSDGVEQLASGASDCPSAHNADVRNHEGHTDTQHESQTTQEISSTGQSQPCGRHVRTVTLKPVHRGQSGEMSGTGESTRMSGHLPAGHSEPGEQRLGFHSPVVIEGLNGNDRGRVGDTDNRIHNASVHRSNDYNIGGIDSNIQMPSHGSNTSVSAGSNVHLTGTQDQRAHAVLPVADNHEVKTDAPPVFTDHQPGYNAFTGRSQTHDHLSSPLTSPESTHAMTPTLLAPSFSDSTPSSQLDTSSVSHDTASTDFHVTPTLSQAGSHSDSTQARSVTNIAANIPTLSASQTRSVTNIAASIPTLSASQGYSPAEPGYQMTQFWSALTQTPPLQSQSSDPWFPASDTHNVNQDASTPGHVPSTVMTPGPRLEEATEPVWSTDHVNDKHAHMYGSHTRQIVSSTVTTLTPSIVDMALSTSQSILTDHSPTLVSLTSKVSSYSAPSSGLQISATTVVEITTTILTVSARHSSHEDTNRQADQTPKDGTQSTSPSVAVTSDTPGKESTSPTNEQQSVSASSVTSLHSSTDGAASTENHIVHTKADPTPTQNPADVDRVVLDRTVKPGLYPVVPENTTSAAEPEAEMPPLFMELRFRMSWPDLCQNEATFRDELVELLQGSAEGVEITSEQMQLMTPALEQCYKAPVSESPEISIRIYMTDKSHQADPSLTMVCARVLQAQLSTKQGSGIRNRLMSVRISGDSKLRPATHSSGDRVHPDQAEVSSFSDPGVTIAVVLAIVAACYCLIVIVMKIIVRCRGEQSSVPRFKHSFSVNSSDSIQLTSVVKSRPNSGLFNPGLDLTDQLEPSNPLNYIQLSMMCLSEGRIHQEYQKIPHKMARLSVVPAGDEDKNRYANVLPLAHTRVRLHPDGPEPQSSYINANYVTGPNNRSHYYIATQGPTEKTTADFWTMVWQQGCKVIVMLTQLEEEGQVKCASYWPELVGKGAAQRHGHLLIQLMQKDVHQEYIYSRLEVNNLREIETREVDHFWYTCWPPVGVPEPISLVKLVLDTRPRYETSGSPLVVHCSPGTGRTCTFIALDLCMRQFDDRRVVDVMKTVHNIRQERAGAVQNKEQYTLLYNAVCEYAMMVVSPGISAASSATTLHALLQS